MRIGIVLSSAPGYSETFFKTKINGLARNGFQVILFALGKRNPELNCLQIRPYPVFQFLFLRVLSVLFIVPFIFLCAPQSVFRFWNYEKENGLSYVAIIKSIYLNAHILTKKLNWLHFGFATTALGRENVARAIDAKMAVSFRGYDITTYPVRHPGCYTQLWNRVDKVHSISYYLLHQAFTLGLPESTPFTIITPAVELSGWEGKVNFELGDPIQIVTVARLTPIKGLIYGIQAIAKLRDAGFNVQYTIVGDGSEREKLVAESNSLGLTNVVIFRGKLSHGDALAQIKNSDCYIQPSLNEGFCNAVLEAQALGCLCIASNIGALPENIIDNTTGWLVPPQNAQSLSEKIMYVLRLPISERQQIAAHARQRVEEKFTLEEQLKMWKLFY